MRVSKILSAILAGFLVTTTVAYAAWPDDRPIEIVVGFSPGGGTDTMARTLARFLEKELGTHANIVVVNKPGAGGELATAYVARAKPDGYTLGMVNVPPYIFIPMYRKTTYQTDDLSMIARLVDDPTLIISSKSGSAPKDLPSILEQLKDKPGSLSFGHSGDGTTGHLALLQLEKLKGVKATSIPFKGSGDGKLALMGNHIDYMIATASEVPELAERSSPYHGVVVASKVRMLKDTPTTVELGYGLLPSSERGIAGPKKLPEEINHKLQNAISEVFKDPAYLEAARNDKPVLSFLAGDKWASRLEEVKQSLEPFVPLISKEK